jgi:SAM-dependent MidA family methyltransferase
MAADPTELELKLIERIKRDGPLTFREFMQVALYHPELGYYNTQRQKIGAEGDYYTSSNVHQAFGAVLAGAVCEIWVKESDNPVIIEFGPGSGQLAHDILGALRNEHPAIFSNLTYVLVEASPSLRNLQQDKLSDFKPKLQWSSLDELSRNPISGIAFSNEVIDALPVHCVRGTHDSIQELCVTTAEEKTGTRLVELWRDPSTRRLREYLEKMGLGHQEGQVVEINLDAIDWLERVSRALKSGLLITIDYGDRAEDLYTPDRKSGTLRCFHRHQLTDSVFKRVGDQDITASVNFTALIEYGIDFGFKFVSFERQTSFLMRYGLIDRIAAEYDPSESEGNLMRRLALKNLFVPGGLSDSFRVLIQRR